MVGVQVPHSYIFLTLIIGADQLTYILCELGAKSVFTSEVPALRNALLFEIGCENYEREVVLQTLRT
jgi:hypothetical protein